MFLDCITEPSWFRPGSRIIITSRDRQVLVAHGVQSHNIHDVSTLSDEDAIRLLSRYAFKTECPAHGYEELSEKVVRYAAGLPLTIKTLSSSLCEGPKDAWEDAIKRLKEIPWGDTLKILKISYDALEEDQKKIFLHVACLLKGERRKRTVKILESLGFHAKSGLRVLEQKSLITFRDLNYPYYYYYYDEWLLDMHDHVEEMGMYIVRSLHPDEPQQRKLLWIRNEIEDIIREDKGTEAIRGIKLEQTDLRPVKLTQSLRMMRRLCFLHVGWTSKIDEFVEAGTYLPSSLQYLHWYGYPYRYLPETFQADKLVTMEMPHSRIHQLWKGEEKKVLPKLRFLDLSQSELETFDSAGMTPNLEELVLRGCGKLVEVNISDECSHLKKLDLYGCNTLEKLTISNEYLSRLESLCLSDAKLRSLNLGMAPNLEELSVINFYDLEELVMPVKCPMLTKLFLKGIDKLRSLNLGSTPNLEVLSVKWCEDLEELVMPVECPMLIKLSLYDIHKLRNLNLGMAPNLEVLSVERCEDLKELVMPVECPMLTKLSLNSIEKLRSFNLGMAPKLEVLAVEWCRDLEELVMPVECPMLTELSLKGNHKLRSLKLGSTPNLKVLLVMDCEDLEELVMPVEYPMLTELSLGGNKKLRSFNLGRAPNLEVLSVVWCKDLEELVMPVECTMLRCLCLYRINKLRSFNLGRAPNLEVLSVDWCKDWEELVMLVELPRLTDLTFIQTYKDEHYYGSFSYLVEKLKSPLEKLRLRFPNMKRLPVDDSIYMLKPHLRVLDLRWCANLEQLPEDLDRLECLEELNLMYCGSLRRIPDCICNMTRLKILDLCYCRQLKKLPDEFTRLQSLQVLDVSYIADRLQNLAESISQLKNLEVKKYGRF